MIHISFRKKPLLFGYSLLWALSQITFPAIKWPDFRKVKHDHFIRHIPIVGNLVDSEHKLRRSRFFKLLCLCRQIYIYTVLSLIMLNFTENILLTTQTQKHILLSFDISKTEELAYKTLFYAPIFYRVGIVALTALSIANMRDREWYQFDRCSIFSLNERKQVKIVLWILLFSLPDSVCGFIETMGALSFGDPNLNKRLRFSYGNTSVLLDHLYLNLILNTLFTAGALLNGALRYRSMLDIAYSAFCIGDHLKNINKQLRMSSYKEVLPASIDQSGGLVGNVAPIFHTPQSLVAGDDIDGAKTRGKGWFANRLIRQLGGTRPNPSRRAANAPQLLSLERERDGKPVCSDGVQKKSLGAEPCQARYTSSSSHNSTSQADLAAAEPATKNSPLSLESLKTITSSSSSSASFSSGAPMLAPRSCEKQHRQIKNSDMISRDGAAGNNKAEVEATKEQEVKVAKFEEEEEEEEEVCTITNLIQLEAHLTQVSCLIYDLDMGAADVVYGMSLLSLANFIYSFFFVVEAVRTYAGIIIGSIFCVFRIAMPFALFISGNVVEKEAKKMIAQLEVIYLQDSTQRLIYKQFSTSMASLSRVFKQLNSIRFTCNNLIRLNLGTMKKFVLYAATSVLIINQYDVLSVSTNDRASEGAPVGIAKSANGTTGSGGSGGGGGIGSNTGDVNPVDAQAFEGNSFSKVLIYLVTGRSS